MDQHPKQLVLAGYDQIADRYLELFGVSEVRQKWFNRLVASLPEPGANVLDLGCGAGVPVSRDLSSLGHKVMGIDGSRRQIAKARNNVPDATFVLSDMTDVDFEDATFDAIGAFYSMTHLPGHEQCELIANIANWLRPGGVFVASFGCGGAGSWSGDWLGVPMFFEHNDETTTLGSLRNNNLIVRESPAQNIALCCSSG